MSIFHQGNDEEDEKFMVAVAWSVRRRWWKENGMEEEGRDLLSFHFI